MSSIRLLSALLLLLFTSGMAVAQPTRWEPVVPMDRQIYPAYLVAMATTDFYKDDGFPHATEAAGLIGFLIRDLKPNSKLKYSIKVPGLVDASYQETLPQGGAKVWLLRPLPWNFDALRKVKQPYSTQVILKLSINDGPPEERVVGVGVRSINEVLIGYRWREQGQPWKWQDTMLTLAAFVNEDHPFIDSLLKEALDTRLIDAFDGYQSDDEQQILRQMLAVWTVLQRRGFRYSSITTSSAAKDHVRSQYVRFLDDSVKTAQSNCVDGSVLWASVLRKIGLRTYLVLVPGHCFLAVDVGSKGKSKIIGLETTMMGSVDLSQPAPAGKSPSLDSFLAAVASGTKSFDACADKLGDALSPYHVPNPDYQFVNIAEARRRHIVPISPP